MTSFEWATLVLGIVTGLGIPAGVFVYNTLRKSIDSLWAKHDTMLRAREIAAADLAEFKLKVSEEYMTLKLLESFEARVTAGFKDLKDDLKTGLAALTAAMNKVGH